MRVQTEEFYTLDTSGWMKTHCSAMGWESFVTSSSGLRGGFGEQGAATTVTCRLSLFLAMAENFLTGS